MRLALSVALAAAAVSVAGCAGDARPLATPNSSAVAGVAASGGVVAVPSTVQVPENETTPTAAAADPTTVPATAPTTTPSTNRSTTQSTVAAPQPIAAAASSQPPERCTARSAALTTPGGRHVVVRAAGLAGPSPTIIVMHGYTSSAEGIEKFSELTSFANSQGVAVMYPQGTATPSGGFGWSTGAGLFATTGTDDVEALSEMIDTAVSTGCVDAARLVISGESNGAGMAMLAICDARLQNRFAAAVLVIPAIDDAVLAHCDPTHAVPIGLSVVAGKLDTTVGYAEGRPPFLPAEAWFELAASAVNGCPAQVPSRVQIDAFVERLVVASCAACTEMFAIADGSHTWPGSSHGAGGLTPGTFALNRRLVDLALNRDQTCLE